MRPRVAIVGAAGWAGSRHADAFRVAGADVTLFADLDPSVTERARSFGASVLEDPWALSKDDADIAVVALPVGMQPEISAHYLRRGLTVLTEKPIAASVDAASPLLERGLDTSQLMVGFMLRFHAGFAAIREWLTTNPVAAVSVRSVAFKPSVTGWRLDAEQGGVTAINAVHALDLVPALYGSKPAVVAAVGHGLLHGIPVEDYVRAMLQFPDGTPFSLESYWAPFPSANTLDGSFDLTIDFVSPSGRAVWRNHRVSFYENDGGARHTDIPGSSNLFIRQAQACISAWQAGNAMPVTLSEGLSATALVDAVRRALRAA